MNNGFNADNKSVNACLHERIEQIAKVLLQENSDKYDGETLAVLSLASIALNIGKISDYAELLAQNLVRQHEELQALKNTVKRMDS